MKNMFESEQEFCVNIFQKYLRVSTSISELNQNNFCINEQSSQKKIIEEFLKCISLAFRTFLTIKISYFL